MLLTVDRPRACLLLALLLALVAALTQASTAGASCYSSTPHSIALGDSPSDGESGLAPEITIVTAAVNATCAYSVDPAITAPLIGGDAVFEYVNVDGDAATGSQVFVGADAVVGSLGATGPDPAPMLGKWDPVANSFSFADAVSVTALGNGGFSASLDQLGVATSPTITTVEVGSMWVGTYDSYFDFAPEPMFEPLPLSVAFSTIAPPPPPATPAPVPVAAPVPIAAPTPVTAPVTTPAPVTAIAKTCTVPSLKRLRTAAAKTTIRRAGCKIGLTRRAYSSTVRSGRVITSSPKAGARWAEPVDLVVSRGPKPKKRHKAHRASAADVRDLLEIAARQLDARR
jgi:hypothetical protein